MSARRTERLLNLVICLMSGSLTREQLQQVIVDYRDSDSPQAFERMFERDKEALRDMGVPLTVDSETEAYRIDPAAYALPSIEVNAEELTLIALAARVWQDATLSAAATDAFHKISAYGTDVKVDPTELGIEPVVSTDTAFGSLYEAVRDAMPVSFDYRRPDEREPQTRHVEPWGIVSWRGHWYLVGHDTDRVDTRVFRLSRIEGEVKRTGPSGSVVIPDGVDARVLVASSGEQPSDHSARLEVKTGSAQALRTRATSVATGSRPDTDVIEVAYSDTNAFVGEVLSLGSAVVVLDPGDLRDAVVRRLRQLVNA